MTTQNPPAGSQPAAVDAALLLLERMGLSLDDLTAAPRQRPSVPAFADHVPVVSAAVTDGTRKAYGSYWNRVTEQWGTRRLDEPTPSEIRQLMSYVKTHVVARRNARGGLADLGQPVVGHGPAGGRQAAGLVHLAGRVLPGGDEPVVLGVPVQAAQRGDQVLLRAAPAPAVAPLHRAGLNQRHEVPDVRRRRLVQAPGAPLLGHPVPVGAVWLAGAVGDRGGHDLYIRAPRPVSSKIRRVRPHGTLARVPGGDGGSAALASRASRRHVP